MSIESYLIKLREATNEVSRLYRELGTIRASRAQLKAEAWRDMEAPSVSAGERYLLTRTVDLDVDEIRVKADIDAWNAEIHYLTTYLQVASDHGRSSHA